MAHGDQGKALNILSKSKGWNPTVIPARDGKPEVDISGWDKSPQAWETSDSGGQWAVRNLPNPVSGAPAVGKLPEGIHDSYPEANEPELKERVTFNHPGAKPSFEERRGTVNFDAAFKEMGRTDWNYPKGRK